MNTPLKTETTNESELAENWTLPPFNADDVARHGADAHRIVTDAQGRLKARCSLWWQSTPPLEGHRLGVIGHFAASNPEAGRDLLTQACNELAAHNRTLAVGPMDGNTWRRYRFVTDLGNEPPFFLEPENPLAWPGLFEDVGFKPLAQYHSALVDDLDYEDPKASLAEDRMQKLGVQLRPVDISRLDEELEAIYRITIASFKNGFLYQPLPESDFRAEYSKIQPFVRPELVLMATHQNRVVGFVFNIPDLLQARRGHAIDTVILKTLAIVPNRTYAGLGRYLTQQTNRVARALGYRRVIHALMHNESVSLNLSVRYGRNFRRYTLFAKPV